jgi:pyruvate kinase
MLALVWGVTSILGEQAGSWTTASPGPSRPPGGGHLQDGDEVILTGGRAGSLPGSTNVVEVVTVGEET